MTGQERLEAQLLIQEAGSLLFLIGGMGAEHMVLVGGLVPPLLVPTPNEPHIGSADIDLCLSVAFTEGATGEYYKSIEEKIRPFFEPADGLSFRWRKKPGAPGVPLLVDFLAPEQDSDTLLADGTRGLDDETAAANAGVVLRPWAIKAGRLLEADSEETQREIDLIYGTRGDQALVRMRHAGPVGFLAAKAAALNGRSEHKDGYDVAWWCLNAAPTPEEVAQIAIDRPSFSDPLVPESLSILRDAFKKTTYPGPTGYARLARRDEPEGSEILEQAKLEAHLVVTEVVERMIAAINWEEEETALRG